MAQRAMIFVNGELPHPQAAQALLGVDDLLIAADGGARHLLGMGINPHVLIGDLDSLTDEEVQQMASAGVKILRYPADKDWTDLELALRYAIDSGCRVIRLIGALGGRLDQTLGNILLLANPTHTDLDMGLDDGVEEVRLVREHLELDGEPGEIVSLLPLEQSVQGVRTLGLRWALNNETLQRHETRGISNEMLGTRAEVFIKSGLLLAVHTRKVDTGT